MASNINHGPIGGCDDCRAAGGLIERKLAVNETVYRLDGKTVWYYLRLCGKHAAARGY